MNVLHWEEVFEKTVCQPSLFGGFGCASSNYQGCKGGRQLSHGRFCAFAFCMQTNACQHGTYVSL